MPGLGMKKGMPGQSWARSIRTFICWPLCSAAKASTVAVSGAMWVISPAAGTTPAVNSSTARSKSRRSYTRAPTIRSSRRKTRCRSTGRGSAWMATTTTVPRTLTRSVAARTAAAPPETSKTTSAPRAAGPVRDPARQVDDGGIEYGEPHGLDVRPTLRIDLDDHHVGTVVLDDGRDHHADRAAAEDDRAIAGGELGAAHVMDRHRGGFHERAVVQPQVRRKRDQLIGAYVPEALQGARGVHPADPEVMADVFV